MWKPMRIFWKAKVLVRWRPTAPSMQPPRTAPLIGMASRLRRRFLPGFVCRTIPLPLSERLLLRQQCNILVDAFPARFCPFCCPDPPEK